MQVHGLSAAVGLLALGALLDNVGASPFAHSYTPGVVLLVAEDAPVEAPDEAADSDKPQDRVFHGNEPLESCMQRWDADTHMTKDEWRRSCERIREERGPYVKDK